MEAVWPIKKLRDLADIHISNVDKKVHASEALVKLCNYMDVYSNEYITSKIQFMDASASIAQIERFSLNYGDVIITKDSETPDDIGIPTVVVEKIDDLVCGYHLALIRPNPEQLDSIYLAKQLSTSQVTRYFAIQASGSTRYGLPISAIEDVEIPTPPKPEQTKIAEILSTVDRAIEQTEALIAKQQRIKTGLMQDLLTRGIDEHGNLRSEQTHQFKDSPLGRIPIEWDWKVLGLIIEIIDCKHYTPAYVEDGIPVIRPRNIKDSGFDLADLDYVTEKGYAFLTDKHEPSDGDIVFSRNASFGVPVYVEGMGQFCIGQDVVVMRRKAVDTRFIFNALKSNPINRQIMNVSGGSTFGRIDLGAIRNLKVAFPKGDDEQVEIAKRLSKCDVARQMVELELAKLHSLKTALMQDLLTGRKRVLPLLEAEGLVV